MAGDTDTSASAGSSGAKPLPLASSGGSSSSGSEADTLRVDFYVLEEASDSARLKLACKLAEKAYLTGQSTLVWHSDAQELKAFDEMLWTFMDGSFVPHDVLSGSSSSQSADQETPVILSAGVAPVKNVDVIINLSPGVPPCLSHTKRVAEIIDGDDARRRAGRGRFKAYRDLGVQPTSHNIRGE
jgi:DNA polymerase-3 subunit chi